jgi:hypothetical protein
MSNEEDFAESSVGKEAVLPDESDDLIPVISEFIVDFL